MFKSGKKKTNAFLESYTLSGKVLGKGAYAEVQLARENKTSAEVAVKIIDKQKMSKGDMKKLNKEVNILKSLRHKNVVRVYDSYDEDEAFYIVMEYVKGGELFTRIVDEENPFTEENSREIILTLAHALKYCKEKGVIHRDIKPENILLTAEEDGGEIKLADFNLSKQIDPEEAEFSVLETMCGTPNYVAPEVISGKPYDYKCDIWSLGVISYLLLSGGYLPFFVDSDGEGRDALLRKVRAGKWQFTPEDAWHTVSPNARDFVKKVLVKDKEARMNYDQLLGHPWFKGTGANLQERINMKKMMELNQARQMLATAKVNQAVNIFKDIMDGKDEEEPTLPAGQSKLGNQDSGIAGISASFQV